MIGVIEYGAGNIKSITNALTYLNIEFEKVSQSSDYNKNVTHLILPGVGAFPHGMKILKQNDLISIIRDHTLASKSFLGICLGMQLLFDYSEEYGTTEGLGLIKGAVLDFSKHISNLHIPHVGWNDCIKKKETIYDTNQSFYFTHSFFCKTEFDEDILTTTNYGIDFTSSVSSKNITGFQFHPEKSHQPGLKLLKTFAESTCSKED